jgi:hypothetical protein
MRRALRVRQSGADLKPPQAAAVKSRGGERRGNAGTRFRQARSTEASASEPLGGETIGHDGLYVEPTRPLYRLNETPDIPEEMLPVVPEYFNGRAYTIFGGSAEIPRDIVAKMVPGLWTLTVHHFGKRAHDQPPLRCVRRARAAAAPTVAWV